MMAACQPFLSGAISKTINLPNEATVEEIADCYLMSWQLGLKANALYRDGSKLSQPLSTKSDKKKKTDDAEAEATEETAGSQLVDLSNLTVDELLEEVQKRMATSTDTKLKRQLSRIVERKSLPAKRRGFTQKARIGGQVLFLRTGEYADGTVGEVIHRLSKRRFYFKKLDELLCYLYLSWFTIWRSIRRVCRQVCIYQV
jgi:ribonucleoside-diphosphate reductase alpha chain